jgi:hypothetical protein
MKNLFNNISQEEKNRILEMHLGNKRVIYENINIITESSPLATELANLIKSSSKELKTELKDILTKTTIYDNEFKILTTSDEIINALNDGRLGASEVKKITKGIINSTTKTPLRDNFIKMLVSTDKYQYYFSIKTIDEAKKFLVENGYLNVDEIIKAYEKTGGKFYKSPSVGAKDGKETKVAATKEVEQSLHTFNDLSERAKQYFDTISKDAKFNSEQINLINKGANRLLNTVFFKLGTGDRYALTNLLKGLEVDLKTVESGLIAQKEAAIAAGKRNRAANIDKFLNGTQNNLKLLSEVTTFIVKTPIETLYKINKATKGMTMGSLGGALQLIIFAAIAAVCAVAYKLFNSDTKVKDAIKIGSDVVKQVKDSQTPSTETKKEKIEW